MSTQTVIFSAGAAKSGTSWLWDYLRDHPQAYFPAVKELHYFDVLEKGGRNWFQKVLKGKVDEAQALADAGTILPYRKKLLADGKDWLAAFDGMTANDEAYLDFIGRGLKDARVIGDFTPSYGTLKEETYARMGAIAEDVRFVVLMREPVDRMWSNVRMDAGAKATAADLDRLVGEVIAEKGHVIAQRSNYRRTLNRLINTVGRDRIYIEFYERLFTKEALGKICDWMGIDMVEPDFGKVVWGGTPAELSEARRKDMADFLKPQYNFVERLMGEIPAEWQQTMVTA